MVVKDEQHTKAVIMPCSVGAVGDVLHRTLGPHVSLDFLL